MPPEAWDGLADGDDPFTRHDFLELLETSGSACARTGWRPRHLVLERDGRAVAAAPLWLKSHSMGEYVFDQAWAEAYARAGGRYYPKLQVAVPFTPVTGPRLLARGTAGRVALVRALLATADRLAVSSLHLTFCREDEARLLQAEGFLLRRGIQFHWHNRGYRDFQDFLDALRSDKRKTIRKERASALSSGLSIETLVGAEARAALRAFFPLYLATVDRRWGNAYLSEAFFAGLAERLAEQVVMVVARAEGRLVAAALNLLGGDTLYGRLWGALEPYRFLHFECCYYRALDFAIGRGLARVEAGAQGPHKLLRGYEPVWTWSAHWLADPALAAAVARFLDQENRRLEREIAVLRAALPYRNSPEG
ncbi:MAG: GNAT family N-acetyltransferase [Geminicoccaceae bacterium]|nr:GNAT family N-acetyltransferase [Geminicoccaceae bacterium]